MKTWSRYHPHVTKSNNIVCTHYVKVSCILCLCIILFDTSKASENLTFILKQSLILSSFCVCIIICCLGAMKIEGSIEEMISNLFPNFDLYLEDLMQIAIQNIFWMAIVDLTRSSFISFTVTVWEKLKLSKSPAEPLKLTHDMNSRRDWDEQNYSRPTRKVKNGQRKEVTVSQDNRIRKWYTHFPLGVILFGWWFWWWRDFHVYWVWKINCC